MNLARIGRDPGVLLYSLKLESHAKKSKISSSGKFQFLRRWLYGKVAVWRKCGFVTLMWLNDGNVTVRREGSCMMQKWLYATKVTVWHECG